MKTFDTRWEEVHQEREWGKYPSEEVVRFVARNFYNSNRKEMKILDIGCGIGAITWYLSRENFDVYAYDGSGTAVKKAKDCLEKEGLKAEIIVADACNTPYESNYFDAIIDSGLIVCNDTKGILCILNECNRVLKTNGKIFSTALVKKGMSGYGTGEKIDENTYRNITEGSVAQIGTVHFFDEAQIIEYWTKAGFRSINIDSLERTDYGGRIKTAHFMVEAEK